MKKNTHFVERILLMIVLFIFGISAVKTAAAETYTATTMRLLKYEGSVEIMDATGASSLVMENIRFNSGDTLHTGADGYASVGLDSSKIVSLDKETSVGFIKDSNAMEMELTEGTIFLDVQEKLDENETLDIKTSNMTIGIRGTIVFVTAARVSVAGPVKTTLGVLEGTARVTVKDENGNKRVVDIPAGEKAVTTPSEGGKAPVLDVEGMTSNDIESFVKEQIETQDGVQERVNPVIDIIKEAQESEINDPASEADWEYTDTVTLVAQSASKMYDGEPLTRTGDVLVYGLPAEYSITVSASGSQTEAGTGDNVVDTYTIKDKGGKDVTKHFKNIECVKGELVVEKAPLTIWTSSANKLYDGTPLVSPDAKLTFSAGYETGQVPWRNTSYVATQKSSASAAAAGDEQILYGVCGITKVHGTNPLTGETKNIDIKAGEKLTVILSDEQDEKSIEFKVEDAKISEIPEEIIRMYADNVQLLNTAAVDAGWTEEQIKELNARIQELTEKDKKLPETDRMKTTDWNGLEIDPDQVDRMQLDLTDVRLTIDTDITNYNNRALGKEETHYTPVKVNNRIKLTATGSQTDVGISKNTYDIDWDGLEGNYEVTEKLGTLSVTPATATVWTGSAEKEYDGKPLTESQASITGLVNGETASVTATGSITEAGTETNTYIIDWGGTNVSNYIVSEDLGTLEVAKNGSVISVSVSVTSKTYDGTPLTGDSIRVDGLPSGIKPASVSVQSAEEVTVSADSDDSGGDFSGYTYKVSVSGSVTDVGSAKCTIDSFRIFDPDGKDVTSQFFNITTEDCILTVTPAQLTVTTGSASKEYDGSALTSSEASISGLVNDETATVTAAGTLTDVGTTDNAYEIEWGTAKKSNYTLTEELGTLEVTENTAEITLKTNSAEKVYDGTALTDDSVTVTGLPDGLTCTAKAGGSQTDAGSSKNTVESYKILDADGKDVTAYFKNITTEEGTLTVTPLGVEFDLNCYTTSFNGYVNIPEAFTGIYEDESEVECESTSYEEDESEMPVSITAVFNLTGGGKVQLKSDGYKDAGTYTLSPEITFTEGNESNYDITFTNNEMVITPLDVEIDLGGDTVSYDGEYHGGDIRVSCALEANEEEKISDTEFKIYWYWGDVIDLEITGGGTDAGAYTLSASYSFNPGTFGNYNISLVGEELTIEKTEATVTTGSASKEYDGTALTNSEASITGLVNDETATVTATGTITDVGTAENTYSIEWGTAKESNYTITENLGTLEITEIEVIINATGGESTVTYDGEYHGATPTVECSLAHTLTKTSDTTWKLSFDEGYSVDIQITGGGTDVGTYELQIAYSTIYPEAANLTYTLTGTTLEITPAEVVFKVNTFNTTYDGEIHTPEGASCTCNGTELNPSTEYYASSGASYMMIFDLPGGQIRLNGTGFTDAGTYDATPYYAFESGTESNYNISFTNTEMKIEKATATVTTGSATGPSGTGYPVTSDEASITGLAVNDESEVTVTATGECTSVGSTTNTYSIDWGNAKSTNYTIVENLGTLTMTNSVIPVSEESTGSVVSTPADGSAAPDQEEENQASDTNETADSGSSDQEKAAAGNSESENSADKAASEEENAESAEPVSEETEEKPEEKTAEDAGGNPEADTVKETEEKSEVEAVKESEEKTEEKAAAETEVKSEEKTEAKKEENTAEKSVEKAEAKVPEKTEEKSEEETGEKAEEETEE